MKIIVEILLVMSLTGTVAFLFYLLGVRLADRYISAGFRYMALKVCLCLFVVPLPLVKLAYVWKFVHRYEEMNGIYYRDVAHSVLLTSGGISFPRFTMNEQVFFCIWAAILLGLLAHRMYRFMKFRQSVVRKASEDERHQGLVESLKKETCIRGGIKVYRCKAPISPCTYGFFRPALLLTDLVNEENAELILRHELQHVKSHDFFIRLAALAVVFLHCFNPLVYLLFWELKEVQEMNCDEKVMETLSGEERRKYGYVILDMADREEPFAAPAMYFSKTNKQFLKKRIKRIAGFSRKKKKLMCGLLAAMCLVSVLPVYAYSPPTSDFRMDDKTCLEGIDWVIQEEIPEGEEERFLFDSADEINFKYADEYIVAEDGEIILLDGTEAARAVCKHVFVEGQYKNHVKKGKGCEVTVYDVVYCQKCRYVKSKTRTSKTNYDVCKHK